MNETNQLLEHQVHCQIEKRVCNKYYEELEREESLLKQASNMQTAFSVLIAAIFMLLPVLLQYRKENADIHYYMFSISLISFCLLLSLTFATLAQWRYKREVLPDNEDLIEGLNEETINQLNQDTSLWNTDIINTYSSIQKSINENNNKRCKFICASMICFFVAIGLCVLLYLIGLMIFY